MSWGVRRTGRGALHSWMVKAPRLMIIIIIPALAPPSFHPAGPCLLAWRHQPARPSGGGRGGRLLAAKEHKTVGSCPMSSGDFLVLGSFLTLEARAEFLKGETEARSWGMIGSRFYSGDPSPPPPPLPTRPRVSFPNWGRSCQPGREPGKVWILEERTGLWPGQQSWSLIC